MWIESHTDLRSNPKFIDLCAMTKWDQDLAEGRLHKLWKWCAHYAQNGDLRKHGMPRINAIMLLPRRSRVLIACQFVDSKPYLRIHDWWDYFGRFLQIKYKNHPEKWLEIKVLYVPQKGDGLQHPYNTPNGNDSIPRPQDLTNQPNQTLTTKETGLLNAASPTPCPKGASARTGNKHKKNCTCEICMRDVVLGRVGL